jgi:branched-chain amino acid transport system ATP-binding protein
MDEPTEGLAPMLIAEVGRVITRLRDQGTSILLAEQNAAFAVRLADAAHVMSKGRVAYSGDPAALWRDEDIKTQLLGVPPVTDARTSRRDS